MKIRDSFATLNRDDTTYDMLSGGLEIIADDGRTLFTISLIKDGSIEISSGGFCKHNGKMLDTPLIIRPKSGNLFSVFRPEFKARP